MWIKPGSTDIKSKAQYLVEIEQMTGESIIKFKLGNVITHGTSIAAEGEVNFVINRTFQKLGFFAKSIN
ncbi:MAG: hypothetical protein JWN56_1546 [Sphingobacteriales bacterium]|nr:hypothetical protein [Sphingobacteriales bacterium]